MITPQGLEMGEKLLWKYEENRYFVFFHGPNIQIKLSNVVECMKIKFFTNDSLMSFGLLLCLYSYFILLCLGVWEVINNERNKFQKLSTYSIYGKFSHVWRTRDIYFLLCLVVFRYLYNACKPKPSIFKIKILFILTFT